MILYVIHTKGTKEEMTCHTHKGDEGRDDMAYMKEEMTSEVMQRTKKTKACKEPEEM